MATYDEFKQVMHAASDAMLEAATAISQANLPTLKREELERQLIDRATALKLLADQMAADGLAPQE